MVYGLLSDFDFNIPTQGYMIMYYDDLLEDGLWPLFRLLNERIISPCVFMLCAPRRWKCMTLVSSGCHVARRKAMYSDAQWNANSQDRLCYDCDRRRCMTCDKLKGYNKFVASTWHLPAESGDVICRTCVRGKRVKGFWTCVIKECRKRKPEAEFSDVIAKYGEGVWGNSKKCNDCIRQWRPARGRIFDIFLFWSTRFCIFVPVFSKAGHSNLEWNLQPKWRQNQSKKVSRRAKMKPTKQPKWKRNGVGGRSDGDLERHTLRRPKKEGSGPLRVACETPCWRQMGARLEQHCNQHRIKIRWILKATFFHEKGNKTESKWEPKCSQNGAQVAPRSDGRQRSQNSENRTGAVTWELTGRTD